MLTQNLIIGLLCIPAGIIAIIFTYKNPDSQLKNEDLKGYIGGIALIVIGVMFILGKLNW